MIKKMHAKCIRVYKYFNIMDNQSSVVLFVPSFMSGRVFLGLTSTWQGLMCLAQGHNTVMPVSLEPAALQSQVKHSTTELPNLLWLILIGFAN